MSPFEGFRHLVWMHQPTPVLWAFSPRDETGAGRKPLKKKWLKFGRDRR